MRVVASYANSVVSILQSGAGGHHCTEIVLEHFEDFSAKRSSQLPDSLLPSSVGFNKIIIKVNDQLCRFTIVDLYGPRYGTSDNRLGYGSLLVSIAIAFMRDYVKRRSGKSSIWLVEGRLNPEGDEPAWQRESHEARVSFWEKQGFTMTERLNRNAAICASLDELKVITPKKPAEVNYFSMGSFGATASIKSPEYEKRIINARAPTDIDARALKKACESTANTKRVQDAAISFLLPVGLLVAHVCGYAYGEMNFGGNVATVLCLLSAFVTWKLFNRMHSIISGMSPLTWKHRANQEAYQAVLEELNSFATELESNGVQGGLLWRYADVVSDPEITQSLLETYRAGGSKDSALMGYIEGFRQIQHYILTSCKV